MSLGTQLCPQAHSGHAALPFIPVSAAGGYLTPGPAITDVKLPVIAWLEAVSPRTLEEGPHLCSSLILPLSVRPHLSALLGIILVNEAWCCAEVPSLPNWPQQRICWGRETHSPPPAISPLQGPVGDAFSFEGILDMGISSLGTWDLAKSQAHPGASLLVQLEPDRLMLSCLLQLLCPCHLGDGCACKRVSLSLCLDTSHVSWLVPGGILWIQLSLGKSFLLCG